jgi:hypothetical protein
MIRPYPIYHSFGSHEHVLNDKSPRAKSSDVCVGFVFAHCVHVLLCKPTLDHDGEPTHSIDTSYLQYQWSKSEWDFGCLGGDGVISVDSAEARAHDDAHKQSDDLL